MEIKQGLFQYAVSLPSQLKRTLAYATLASLADATLVILKSGKQTGSWLKANTSKYLDSSLGYEENTKAPTN